MQDTLISGFVIVTRALCPFCLILAGLAVYDLVMPSDTIDTAVVTGKSTSFERRGPAYRVQARGCFAYNERVDKSHYSLVREGDKLQISLSRTFSEWKLVSVIRGGKVIDARRPAGLKYVGLLAGLYVLTGAAFLPRRILFSNRLFPIVVAAGDFVGVAMWYRLIGVWTGQFDKI